MVFAGMFIVLAVLSKGFPGFFPITVPFLHWLFIRKHSFSKTILYSVGIGMILLIAGMALYFYPASHQSLSIYLFKRAFQRITEMPSVESRFFIFWRLLSELIPAFAFTFLVFLIARWKKINSQFSTYNRYAFLFVSIGLSGSLPLMLTRVQNGFYFVASLPFFGIGFALFTAPIMHQWIQKIPEKKYNLLLLSGLFIFLTAMTLCYLQKDTFSRDKDLLNDIDLFASKIPSNTRVNCSHNTYQNWALNCYLVRYHHISINDIDYDPQPRSFFINEINASAPDSSFEEIKMPTTLYRLYRKKTKY
jgi:hypothetical protein